MSTRTQIAGAVLAVVVAGAGAGAVWAATSGRDTPPPAPPAPSSTQPAPVTSTPPAAPPPAPPAAPTTTVTLEPTPPPPPVQLRVAAGFADAWVVADGDITNAEWTGRLDDYVTPELGGQLQSVDPSRVPASVVTGPATAVEEGRSVWVADVPTDGPVLRITVVDTPGGWLVADYTDAG